MREKRTVAASSSSDTQRVLREIDTRLENTDLTSIQDVQSSAHLVNLDALTSTASAPTASTRRQPHEPPPSQAIQVINVVGLCRLVDYSTSDSGGFTPPAVNLPLEQICTALYAKYDVQVFPAGISKCRESNCTHLIFRDGTLVGGGGKTEQQVLSSLQLLTCTLNTWLPFHVTLHEFVVTNVMAVFAVGRRINMTRLSARFHGDWQAGVDYLGLKIKHQQVARRVVCYIVYPHGIVSVTGIGKVEDVPLVEAHGREMLAPFLL